MISFKVISSPAREGSAFPPAKRARLESFSPPPDPTQNDALLAQFLYLQDLGGQTQGGPRLTRTNSARLRELERDPNLRFLSTMSPGSSPASSRPSSRQDSPVLGRRSRGSGKRRSSSLASPVPQIPKKLNLEDPVSILAEFKAQLASVSDPKILGHHLNMAVYCQDIDCVNEILAHPNFQRKSGLENAKAVLDWAGFDLSYRDLGGGMRLIESCDDETDYLKGEFPYAHGFTSLYWAAFKNNLDLAKRLLDFGADPMMFSIGLMGPIDIAMARGNRDFFELIYSHENFDKTAWRASISHSFSGIHLSLQYMTPDSAHRAILDSILHDFPDILSQVCLGNRRPLEFAIGAYNRDSFLYLLDHAVDFNCPVIFKQLVLEYDNDRDLNACRDFVKAIVQKALEKDAVNSEQLSCLLHLDKEDNTAFHYAASVQVINEALCKSAEKSCPDSIQKAMMMTNKDGQVPRDFYLAAFNNVEGFPAHNHHLLGRFPPNTFIAYLKACLGIGLTPNKNAKGEAIYSASSEFSGLKALLRNDPTPLMLTLKAVPLHLGYTELKNSDLNPILKALATLRPDDKVRIFQKLRSQPEKYKAALERGGVSLADLEAIISGVPISKKINDFLSQLVYHQLSQLNVPGLAAVITGVPSLEDPQKLSLVARMIAAFFCTDDRAEELSYEAAQSAKLRLLTIMSGTEPDPSSDYPDFIEMASIRADITRLNPKADFSVWIESMEQQMDSVLWEIECKAAQQRPQQGFDVDSLPFYKTTEEWGAITAGYYPVMVLVDLLLGIPRFSQKPEIQAFDKRVADLVRKVNDLDSFRKELLDALGERLFSVLEKECLTRPYDQIPSEIKSKLPICPIVILAAKEHQSLLHAWIKTAYLFNRGIKELEEEYQKLQASSHFTAIERQRLWSSMAFAFRTHDWQTTFSGRYSISSKIDEEAIQPWAYENKLDLDASA